ncbi:MAG TPA: hypothetical protein ENI33_08775 [Thermoplasmatales archaeon]|nr:hypothetical protein [Thermoplasmatales archaeon]
MHFRSEKSIEKNGYIPLIILFIIFRILDVITTEIGLYMGYEEHHANFIFYGMKNPYLSYILSGIVIFSIIGLCMFGYSYLKKKER